MSAPSLLTAARFDFATAPSLDWSAALTLTDANGDAIDLTGGSFIAQISTAPGMAVLAEFDTTVTNAAAGMVTLTLPRAEVENLTAGETYFYDVLFINSAELSSLILQGRITVRDTVSMPS